MHEIARDSLSSSSDNPAVPARVFVLPGSMTIENIEATAEEMRKLEVAPGETLTLDAANTEIITTPGVQLILSLAATLEQSSAALIISKPKEAFIQSFEALGLSSRLTQWEDSTWQKKS